MKMPSGISKVGSGSQLALIAAIFFLSFLTFNILFKATTGDNYFQEIIAALIGTILAAVITTMLLRSQTKGEELKERNVEVFRKKVEVYEMFLDQALKYMEDGLLSDEEVQQLRRSIYRLSLFSSEDTITTVIRFLRAQYMQDSDSNLEEVISAFRKELALENVNEIASWDMQAIETLLRGANRTSFEALRSVLEDFEEAVLAEIIKKSASLSEGAETSGIEGSGNGFSFDLSLASNVSYGFSLDYSNDPTKPRLVLGFMDVSELPVKDGEKLLLEAVSLGLEEDDDEETPLAERTPTLLIDTALNAAPGQMYKERRVWTVSEFSDVVLTIERAARAIAKPKTRGRER